MNVEQNSHYTHTGDTMRLQRIIYHTNLYCTYKEIDETLPLSENYSYMQARQKAEELNEKESRKNTKWEVQS